jgi:ankyrin repeat protein
MTSFPGYCEIVELLLSRGIDVDVYSVRGTPLHAAALYKQDCTMKILLEHHADVRHQFLCSLLGSV